MNAYYVTGRRAELKVVWPGAGAPHFVFGEWVCVPPKFLTSILNSLIVHLSVIRNKTYS